MRDAQLIASQTVTCARIYGNQTGTRWVSDHRFHFTGADVRSASLKDELESILCDTREVRDKDPGMWLAASPRSLESLTIQLPVRVLALHHSR